MPATADAREKLPPRYIPLLYLGTAHVSLALACFLVGWSPHAVAGFFYHAWLVAIVHMVTLGWITLSILGAMYIVAPAALRMTMRGRRIDYVAYALAVIGIVGMIGHFWIQEYGGMAWSAATVTTGIVIVATRIVLNLRHAKIPLAVRLHVGFSCLNILIAASMGILLGFDKAYHVLPGFVLSNVFAHAHLAAIGWATMMVVGVAYRLLPMTLPAKTPSGRSIYLSAILMETGVLGLFTTLLLRSAWADLFGLLIVAGLGAFLAHVIGMVRSPRPKPAATPPIDFAVLHALAAGVWLIVACALGLTLLFAPASDWTLRAAGAYGVAGLLGFLAQMVVAMEARLLPLFAWYWAYANSDFSVAPPPPLAMRDLTRQGIVFAGWTFGVPAVAVGFFLNAAPLLGAGAWALLAAVLVGLLDSGVVVAHAFSAGRQSTGAGIPAPHPKSA